MTHDSRVASLDQFRGYSVAGMFVVNFLGAIEATHHVLRHNNTHFSYADSIMPSFILICGFSYRLTFLKRSSTPSPSGIKRRYLTRSLALILVSLVLFGFGRKFGSYNDLTLQNIQAFAARLIKADLWEVLAIVGACQILLLPLIAASAMKRSIAMVALAVTHVGLSGWFNWDFVYGLPNFLDARFGSTGKAWDGGLFGLLSWSEIMLAGSLLPDIVAGLSVHSQVRRLIAIGFGMMAIGYSASCLTRLYDRSPTDSQNTAQAISEVSVSPVWPPWDRLSGRSWESMLAEPPFVPPPPPSHRQPNYWAMDKRIVSQSFVFFSTGFAIALYGLFVWVCDGKSLTFKPFHTFGTNPLAAYIIHHAVQVSLLALFPKNSAILWGVLGMAVSVFIAYTFVRFLEKRQLYLRL
jgi:predicted acyltransferase